MDPPRPPDRVAAVVALKTMPGAKSRMSPLPAPVRERLARCLALDTLAALVPAVDLVLVISDQPDLSAVLRRHGIDVRVIPEPEAEAGTTSLNRALAHGDARLRKGGFGQVLACVGDLPALRPASVRRVLAASAEHRRSFLADHDERGTTMLIARRTSLDPLYGAVIEAGRSVGSAQRHRRSGAVPISLGDVPEARWDVDTVDDLRVVCRLGLGRLTAGMVDPATGSVGAYRSVQMLGRDAQTITVQDGGGIETVDLSAYDGDPAHLVPGRRLHAVRVAGALRCWV